MDKIKIGIVDYGVGNIRSIANALKSGDKCDVVVSREESELSICDGLILPGVGAFDAAMKSLESSNIRGFLDTLILEKKTPVLAICLGMQMLFDSSEEGVNHKGLGWISGKVVKFDHKNKLRIPHMGWNNISIKKESSLLASIENGEDFYFVHSYHVICDSKYVIANCSYGHDFTAIIQKDNIYGIQCHPEKSQVVGQKVLANFIKIVEENESSL